MKRLAPCLGALGLSLGLLACDEPAGDAPKAPTKKAAPASQPKQAESASPKTASPGQPDTPIPVPADYEDEVQAEITEDNYEAALDEIEQALEE